MTTKILIVIIFTTFLATSCGDKTTKEINYSPFQNFIFGLDKVELPFHYDLVNQDIENSSKPKPADTPFIETQDYIMGLLPDTLDNYKVLYLRTGDDFYPSLKVFSKIGKTLSDNLICFPDCAAGDCEFDSCNSHVDIQTNKIVRTISTVTTACDSIGNKILNSTSKNSKTDYISVTKSGQLKNRRQ